MGFELFKTACHDGTRDPNIAYLICYARYLNNGGSKSDWLDLTLTDITMMNTQYLEDKAMSAEGQAILTANAIGRALGGTSDQNNTDG